MSERTNNLPKKAAAALLSAVIVLADAAFLHAAESNFWKERRASASSRNAALGPVASLPTPAASLKILKGLPDIKPQTLSPSVMDTLSAEAGESTVRRHMDVLRAIPPAYGMIRRLTPAAKGPAGKTVIFLQDVHENHEAQTNLGKIVEALLDCPEAKVSFVGLEAAFAPLEIEKYRKFHDQEAVRTAADYMLKENRISGPVHAAYTHTGEVAPFLGVDDPARYRANVEAYRLSAPGQKEAKRAVAIERFHLGREKKRAYNADLAAFDRTVEGYHGIEQAVTFGGYAREVARASGIAEGPLAIFLEALTAEKSLDFKAVERERTQLIEDLVKKLDRDGTEALVKFSIDYRAGNLGHEDYYRKLKAFCRENGVDLAGYSNMGAYVRYVLLSGKIDAEKLFKGLKEAEAAAYARLAKTPDEKRLVRQSRRLTLEAKLLTFSLTPDEWAEYEESSHAAGFGPYETFYREAEARNDAMSANVLKAMEERKSETAVVVAGGFHTAGMTKLLAERGVAVVEVAPKITKVEGSASAYLGVFTQEKTPLEKLFKGERLFVGKTPDKANVNLEMPAMTALEVVLETGNAEQGEDDFRDLAGEKSGVFLKVDKAGKDAASGVVTSRETGRKARATVRKRGNGGKRGFTLVELFGVIVILTGLAMIGMRAFARFSAVPAATTHLVTAGISFISGNWMVIVGAAVLIVLGFSLKRAAPAVLSLALLAACSRPAAVPAQSPASGATEQAPEAAYKKPLLPRVFPKDIPPSGNVLNIDDYSLIERREWLISQIRRMGLNIEEVFYTFQAIHALSTENAFKQADFERVYPEVLGREFDDFIRRYDMEGGEFSRVIRALTPFIQEQAGDRGVAMLQDGLNILGGAMKQNTIPAVSPRNISEVSDVLMEIPLESDWKKATAFMSAYPLETVSPMNAFMEFPIDWGRYVPPSRADAGDQIEDVWMFLKHYNEDRFERFKKKVLKNGFLTEEEFERIWGPIQQAVDKALEKPVGPAVTPGPIAGAKPRQERWVGDQEEAEYVEKEAPAGENKSFFIQFFAISALLSAVPRLILGRFFSDTLSEFSANMAGFYTGSFIVTAFIAFWIMLWIFVRQHRVDMIGFEETITGGRWIWKSQTTFPGRGQELMKRYAGSVERGDIRNLSLLRGVMGYYQFENGRWILKAAKPGSEKEARVQRELYAKGWRIFSPVLILAVGAGMAGFVASQLIGPWGGLVAIVAGAAGFGPIYRASLGIHEGENRPFDGNVAAAMPDARAGPVRGSALARLAAVLSATVVAACISREEVDSTSHLHDGRDGGALDGGRMGVGRTEKEDASPIRPVRPPSTPRPVKMVEVDADVPSAPLLVEGGRDGGVPDRDVEAGTPSMGEDSGKGGAGGTAGEGQGGASGSAGAAEETGGASVGGAPAAGGIAGTGGVAGAEGAVSCPVDGATLTPQTPPEFIFNAPKGFIVMPYEVDDPIGGPRVYGKVMYMDTDTGEGVEVYLPGQSLHKVVQRGNVLVVLGGETMDVLDVSNPTAPELLASVELEGYEGFGDMFLGSDGTVYVTRLLREGDRDRLTLFPFAGADTGDPTLLDPILVDEAPTGSYLPTVGDIRAGSDDYLIIDTDRLAGGGESVVPLRDPDRGVFSVSDGYSVLRGSLRYSAFADTVRAPDSNSDDLMAYLQVEDLDGETEVVSRVGLSNLPANAKVLAIDLYEDRSRLLALIVLSPGVVVIVDVTEPDNAFQVNERPLAISYEGVGFSPSSRNEYALDILPGHTARFLGFPGNNVYDRVIVDINICDPANPAQSGSRTVAVPIAGAMPVKDLSGAALDAYIGEQAPLAETRAFASGLKNTALSLAVFGAALMTAVAALAAPFVPQVRGVAPLLLVAVYAFLFALLPALLWGYRDQLGLFVSGHSIDGQVGYYQYLPAPFAAEDVDFTLLRQRLNFLAQEGRIQEKEVSPGFFFPVVVTEDKAEISNKFRYGYFDVSSEKELLVFLNNQVKYSRQLFPGRVADLEPVLADVESTWTANTRVRNVIVANALKGESMRHSWQLRTAPFGSEQAVYVQNLLREKGDRFHRPLVSGLRRAVLLSWGATVSLSALSLLLSQSLTPLIGVGVAGIALFFHLSGRSGAQALLASERAHRAHNNLPNFSQIAAAMPDARAGPVRGSALARLAAVLSAAVVAACVSREEVDSMRHLHDGRDGGALDGGRTDAGRSGKDGGKDVAVPESGKPDARVPVADAAVPDAGKTDANIPASDAAAPEFGKPDARVPVADAAEREAGTRVLPVDAGRIGPARDGGAGGQAGANDGGTTPELCPLHPDNPSPIPQGQRSFLLDNGRTALLNGTIVTLLDGPSYTAPGNVISVIATSSGYVVLAGRSLIALDDDLANPVEIAALPDDNPPTDRYSNYQYYQYEGAVMAQGRLVVLRSKDGGEFVTDMIEPYVGYDLEIYDPVSLEKLDEMSVSFQRYSRRPFFRGSLQSLGDDHLVVSTNWDIKIFSLADILDDDQGSPEAIAAIRPPDSIFPSGSEVVVVGTHIVVGVSGNRGEGQYISIYEACDPAAPVLLGTVPAVNPNPVDVSNVLTGMWARQEGSSIFIYARIPGENDDRGDYQLFEMAGHQAPVFVSFINPTYQDLPVYVLDMDVDAENNLFVMGYWNGEVHLFEMDGALNVLAVDGQPVRMDAGVLQQNMMGLEMIGRMFALSLKYWYLSLLGLVFRSYRSRAKKTYEWQIAPGAAEARRTRVRPGAILSLRLAALAAILLAAACISREEVDSTGSIHDDHDGGALDGGRTGVGRAVKEDASPIRPVRPPSTPRPVKVVEAVEADAGTEEVERMEEDAGVPIRPVRPPSTPPPVKVVEVVEADAGTEKVERTEEDAGVPVRPVTPPSIPQPVDEDVEADAGAKDAGRAKTDAGGQADAGNAAETPEQVMPDGNAPKSVSSNGLYVVTLDVDWETRDIPSLYTVWNTQTREAVYQWQPENRDDSPLDVKVNDNGLIAVLTRNEHQGISIPGFGVVLPFKLTIVDAEGSVYLDEYIYGDFNDYVLEITKTAVLVTTAVRDLQTGAFGPAETLSFDISAARGQIFLPSSAEGSAVPIAGAMPAPGAKVGDSADPGYIESAAPAKESLAFAGLFFGGVAAAFGGLRVLAGQLLPDDLASSWAGLFVLSLSIIPIARGLFPIVNEAYFLRRHSIVDTDGVRKVAFYEFLDLDYFIQEDVVDWKDFRQALLQVSLSSAREVKIADELFLRADDPFLSESVLLPQLEWRVKRLIREKVYSPAGAKEILDRLLDNPELAHDLLQMDDHDVTSSEELRAAVKKFLAAHFAGIAEDAKGQGRWILQVAEPGSKEERRVKDELRKKGAAYHGPLLSLVEYGALFTAAAGFIFAYTGHILLTAAAAVPLWYLSMVFTGAFSVTALGVWRHRRGNKDPQPGQVAAAMPDARAGPVRGSALARLAAALSLALLSACGASAGEGAAKDPASARDTFEAKMPAGWEEYSIEGLRVSEDTYNRASKLMGLMFGLKNAEGVRDRTRTDELWEAMNFMYALSEPFAWQDFAYQPVDGKPKMSGGPQVLYFIAQHQRGNIGRMKGMLVPQLGDVGGDGGIVRILLAVDELTRMAAQVDDFMGSFPDDEKMDKISEAMNTDPSLERYRGEIFTLSIGFMLLRQQGHLQIEKVDPQTLNEMSLMAVASGATADRELIRIILSRLSVTRLAVVMDAAKEFTKEEYHPELEAAWKALQRVMEDALGQSLEPYTGVSTEGIEKDAAPVEEEPGKLIDSRLKAPGKMPEATTSTEGKSLREVVEGAAGARAPERERLSGATRVFSTGERGATLGGGMAVVLGGVGTVLIGRLVYASFGWTPLLILLGTAALAVAIYFRGVIAKGLDRLSGLLGRRALAPAAMGLATAAVLVASQGDPAVASPLTGRALAEQLGPEIVAPDALEMLDEAAIQGNGTPVGAAIIAAASDPLVLSNPAFRKAFESRVRELQGEGRLPAVLGLAGATDLVERAASRPVAEEETLKAAEGKDAVLAVVVVRGQGDLAAVPRQLKVFTEGGQRGEVLLVVRPELSGEAASVLMEAGMSDRGRVEELEAVPAEGAESPVSEAVLMAPAEEWLKEMKTAKGYESGATDFQVALPGGMARESDLPVDSPLIKEWGMDLRLYFPKSVSLLVGKITDWKMKLIEFLVAMA